VHCELCTCALFVGEKCECGALEHVPLLLELRQCDGAGGVCASSGANLGANDLKAFAGAGAMVDSVILQMWERVFGVYSFCSHDESVWRGCKEGVLQDLRWWLFWSVGAGPGAGFAWHRAYAGAATVC